MSENTSAQTAQAFFDDYTRAQLERDARVIADLYAVPGLIQFPDQAIAVSSPAQTEEFFTAAFSQYADITEVRPDVEVIAETGHSMWVDVTWFHDGALAERFMYQLVRSAGRWKIAVLTPLET